MPLFKKVDTANASMGIWKMTESLPELEAMYEVKPSEREIYDGFRNDRRRKEWLSVRILLRAMLGNDVEICYRESGKPYLRDSSHCISITHTIGYVGIRLASHPVALDMEYFSKRVLHLIPRYVSYKERKYIPTTDGPEQIYAALIIWSAKETVFKLFDFSDVLFDEHIFISNLRLGKSGHFKGSVVKDGFQADVWLTYEVYDELILVYC